MDADKALRKLTWGNLRYVNERYANKNIDLERRWVLAEGQQPFAVIFGCSDSRVPPEIVFDQGLGDLFVVRTAGQTVDNITLGSIEYAVNYLGVRLIVVLGHQDCGAVKLATKNNLVPGQISSVIKEIKPAVQIAEMQSGSLVTNAIINNIYLGVDKLLASPLLRKAMLTVRLKIVGALYCIKDGKVVFL